MKKTFKRTIQRMIASTLTAVMLFGVVTSNQLIAYGYTAKTGMIYSSGKSLVETKVSASPNAAKANGLEYGKPVTVINETTGTDGLIWYQVTYKLKAGGSNTAYVPRANVLLDSDVTVFANGHINANEVAFRDDAGTDRTTILASLYVGHTLELLDSTTVSGSLWYRVRTTINGTSSIGWVYGAYVTVDEENIETEEEYEAYLRGLGFPESYVHKLAVLHAKYPNWVFQPYSTGLNWNTVITQESYPGRNLVYKTEDDAKKSMDYRAYTWSTNTWTVYDSSGWVSAHPDFIAYCMDPRNFLNETNIWMFESLSYSASHTTSGVAAIIKGTFMEKATYLDYKSVFMQVAKTTGVSAYHIASRIRQEQGVNGSKMISGTYPGYEGYYNYFNIGAAGVGEKVYTSGLSRAKKEGWNTRLKAIQGGAAFIGSK